MADSQILFLCNTADIQNLLGIYRKCASYVTLYWDYVHSDTGGPRQNGPTFFCKNEQDIVYTKWRTGMGSRGQLCGAQRTSYGENQQNKSDGPRLQEHFNSAVTEWRGSPPSSFYEYTTRMTTPGPQEQEKSPLTKKPSILFQLNQLTRR